MEPITRTGGQHTWSATVRNGTHKKIARCEVHTAVMRRSMTKVVRHDSREDIRVAYRNDYRDAGMRKE